MGELADRFPLFPLGLVLLPTEVVPLHIFEERYKLMIGRCIEEECDFGIVWLAEGGLRDVGCSATVTQVSAAAPASAWIIAEAVMTSHGRRSPTLRHRRRSVVRRWSSVSPNWYSRGCRGE